MTPEGIAQAKDQAIKSQSRKRPSSSSSSLFTTLRVCAAKREVEHKYSAHRAIEKKLAGLGVLASSEEFEAFKKEFTDSQGVAAFDALIKFLRLSRKKYVLQNVAPPNRKSKLMPGERASSQVKKGYELYQKSVSAGEKPDWEEIARECLPNPGKANSKATWQQRKSNFRKAIFAHKRRLKKG
jgi:hypothetical protein